MNRYGLPNSRNLASHHESIEPDHSRFHLLCDFTSDSAGASLMTTLLQRPHGTETGAFGSDLKSPEKIAFGAGLMPELTAMQLS